MRQLARAERLVVGLEFSHPGQIVARANAVLKTLEGDHRVVEGPPPRETDPGQLPLFLDVPPDPTVAALRELDVDAMTPLEALNRLAELKRRAGGQADGRTGGRR